jgi:hypothetical protein
MATRRDDTVVVLENVRSYFPFVKLLISAAGINVR